MPLEFYMIFFAYYFSGEERAAATGNLGLNLTPLLQGQNSGRKTVARDARLGTDSASPKKKSCQRGIFGM